MIATKPAALAVCAIFVFLGAAPLLAQQSGARGQYLVELQSAEDADKVVEALTRKYAGWVETPSGSGTHGLIFSLTEERAQQLASDPRVKSVRSTISRVVPAASEPAARVLPAKVGTDGTPMGPVTLGPYKYDAAGNIIHIGNERYTYDRMGRVLTGTAYTSQNSATQSFSYDGFGNLKVIDTPFTTKMYVDSDWQTNKLKSSAGTETGAYVAHTWAGGANGGYDAAGNQTGVNGGMYTYAYDSLNALTRLSGPRTELYLYDGNEDRVVRVQYISASSATWRYALRDANSQVLREVSDTVSNGAHAWRLDKDYVYRNGARLAAIKPLATGGDQRSHFHLDHLGSPVLITDDNGDRLASHKYWPFGTEAPGGDNDGERMKFTGHERDLDGTDANALDYMRARYYRSASGRFLSVDPATPQFHQTQSWNAYAYVRNNPVMLVDPTGKYDIYCIPGSSDCDKEKAEFEAARLRALSSPDQKTKEAAAVYGTPGQTNGVYVVIGWPLSDPRAGAETRVQPGFVDGGKARFEGLVMLPYGVTGTVLEERIAHEGSHLLDGKNFIETIDYKNMTWDLTKNLTHFQTEFNAYRVSAAVYNRANIKRDLCENCNYPVGKGVSPSQTDQNIKKYLADAQQLYKLTPQAPGNRQVEGPYSEPPPK